MELPHLDAGTLVAQVRAGVTERSWAPSPPPDSGLTPMIGHPALAYLHRHWALRRILEPGQRRLPVTGARSAARALLGRLAFAALRPYLAEEEELLAHAVRLLDALARRCDAMVEGQAAELDAIRADLGELAARIEGRREPERGG